MDSLKSRARYPTGQMMMLLNIIRLVTHFHFSKNSPKLKNLSLPNKIRIENVEEKNGTFTDIYGKLIRFNGLNCSAKNILYSSSDFETSDDFKLRRVELGRK